GPVVIIRAASISILAASSSTASISAAMPSLPSASISPRGCCRSPAPIRRLALRRASCLSNCAELTDESVCPTLNTMRKAVCGLLLVLSLPVWAQGVHPISGRKYANVMGANGADWLVRPERETEEEPDAALDAIGIARGDVVADVGAGAGYMSWRM